MKRDVLKVRLTSALLLILLLAQGAVPARARQAGRGGVTKEEEREARETAAAFTRRLLETHDFAPVVKELYVGDFMARYLKHESDAGPHSESAKFMLEGVPALSFREALAARGDSEYWPRLYVAAQTFMHFGFLSILSKKSLKEAFGGEGGFDQKDMLDVYPPEAVKVLDGNPTLANFLLMKGRPVDVKTADDLRAVTVTLEEAVRLTRAHLDERLAKGGHLAENLRMMEEAAARTQVELLPLDGDFVGYPEGTRLFKVFTPAFYQLILVKDGGAMKVVWASVPSE
jgi:hypothetical protein